MGKHLTGPSLTPQQTSESPASRLMVVRRSNPVRTSRTKFSLVELEQPARQLPVVGQGAELTVDARLVGLKILCPLGLSGRGGAEIRQATVMLSGCSARLNSMVFRIICSVWPGIPMML
jgi:hypothetical protein